MISTPFVVSLFVLLIQQVVICSERSAGYVNQFAVRTKRSADPDDIAKEFKCENDGPVGQLENTYLFTCNHISKRSLEYAHAHHAAIKEHRDVVWVAQQESKIRVKRSVRSKKLKKYRKDMTDPLYKEQWYLVRNQNMPNKYDMSVKGAWAMGFTGRGVVISILDDGIQRNHPDLELNYDPQASYDINDNDPDPTPRDDGDNKHGTRCAGEVSAVAYNDICGVGIAFNSSIGGVRMLDGTVTDAVEARALSLNPNHVDIYSASWGPEDDGKTVDGPGSLAKRAFMDGIAKGRRGLGSIYVWASGNGGRRQDNCNCDGYTNSIFTLSISSATQRGRKPWYLEECSSTLATTYSSGSPLDDANIVTVDMDTSYYESLRNGKTPDKGRLCTKSHTGTSASAPIAAGIVALALQANPKLSWRDVQHIVVLTSRPKPLLGEKGWIRNGFGRMVSHKFGYGLMDAEAMVNLSLKWRPVPQQVKCRTHEWKSSKEIPGDPARQLEVVIPTDGCRGTKNAVNYLEHVQATLSLNFQPRGKLKITLVSPSGTESHLLFKRPNDIKEDHFDHWSFLSVHFWGEEPGGNWRLIIRNDGSFQGQSGKLTAWSLTFHGTYQKPDGYQYYQNDSYHYLPRSTSLTKQPLTECATRGMFKVQNGDTCVLECPEGQYGDYETGTCGDCHTECQSCFGAASDNCLSCKDTFYYGDKCLHSCPKGFYADAKLRECLPCSSNCETCSNTPDRCTSCRQAFVLNEESHCVLECHLNRTCPGCHNSCLSCLPGSPDVCLTCKDGHILFGGRCLAGQCPLAYYMDGHSCNSCHKSCKACTGPSHLDCLSCHTDGILKHGLCQRCPPHQYLNLDTQSCEPCHQGCASCKGPTSTDCISCHAPLFLDGSRCVPCCHSDYETNLNEILNDCCLCQSSSGPCRPPKLARNVNSETRPFRKSDSQKRSTWASVLIEKSTTVILAVCVLSIVIFIAVFLVLETNSSGLLTRPERTYKDYRKVSTVQYNSRKETVVLTSDDEEDSLYEKT